MSKSISYILALTFLISTLSFNIVFAATENNSDFSLTMYKTLFGEYKDAAYGNGLFAAVGKKGAVCTSNDGIEWIVGNTETAEDLNAVIWTGECFIAVGGRGCILSSSDGLIWNTVNFSPGYTLESVNYSKGKYISVGFENSSRKGIIFISDDGINWTLCDYRGIGEFDSIASDGNTFIIAGGYGNSTHILLSSSDGVNWTDRYDKKKLGDQYFLKVFYGGGKFVALGGHVSFDCAVSNDGINWERGFNKGKFYTPYCGVWNGDNYILMGVFDLLYRSRDGLTWESYNIKNFNARYSLRNIIFVNNKYIAVSLEGDLFLGLPEGQEPPKNIPSLPRINTDPLPNKDGISSWARKGVENIWRNHLADFSIFNEYSKRITREEFAMMAVKLYEMYAGLPLNFKDTNKFNDIDDSAYKEYIIKANNLELISGIGGDKFNPKGEITRQEIAVILAILVHKVSRYDKSEIYSNTEFSDDAEIAIWAKSSIQNLYNSRIISGIESNPLKFGPLEKTTREMAMLLIYKIGIAENIIK